MIENNLAFKNKYQLIILLLLAVGLNINTLFNDYVVDDYVLTRNSLVEKGIKGIPEILTTEYFYGTEKRNADLTGGRYRPLALVIFALEYQFWGIHPMVSHLINILLFALLIALLYKLLRFYIFRDRHPFFAFITCLLFVVHPIHTEVIANVKSRDEIITFIFLIVSSFAFIKYSIKKSVWLILSGLLCFFLALLTRESAVPFVGVFPITMYFFFNQSIKKSLLFTLPLFGVLIAYLVMRTSIVGFTHTPASEILNAPFYFASPLEAFATKVFILFRYLWLLLFPYSLSWDYGYNQIPYISIHSLPFILSSLLWIVLIVYAIYKFKIKSLFSYCILYFLITIFLFANFIINIGAPLAERLLFQPSLAFCIVATALYLKAVKNSKVIVNTVSIIILFLFSLKTITRNAEWKNYSTLNFADVITCPNSARTNFGATEAYLEKAKVETNLELRKEYFKKAAYHSERLFRILPNDPDVIMYLESTYSGLLDCFKTANLFLQDYKTNHNDTETKKRIESLSSFLYKQGNGLSEQGKIDDAINCYKKAVELDTNNVEAWYNLGGNYFMKNDTIDAIDAWNKVKKLEPDHKLSKEDFTN